MAANLLIECISRDIVPKYCHDFKSSMVYTAPAFFIESCCTVACARVVEGVQAYNRL